VSKTGRLNVCVVGGGAWGTALACVSARAGHTANIWARDPRAVHSINQDHRLPQYLSDFPLEPEIKATHVLEEALARASLIFMATPAQTIGEMARTIAPHIAEGTNIIVCAKGIDRTTGLLPSQFVAREIPVANVSVLSGPSFASDVVRKLPTAVTIASQSMEQSRQLTLALSVDHFRCYAGDDIKGTELGGALKNVLALAVGACRGMKLGASAEAALIARGFAEISRIAVALGAQPGTLSGLSGLGQRPAP